MVAWLGTCWCGQTLMDTNNLADQIVTEIVRLAKALANELRGAKSVKLSSGE